MTLQRLRYTAIGIFLCVYAAAAAVPDQQPLSCPGPQPSWPGQPPPDLERLRRAYPDTFEVRYHESSGWGVRFPDGTFIPWDEGKQHDSYANLLADPNLKDMFRFPYPGTAPHRNVDPGRIRHQGFFQALYGSSRAEVEQHLTEIPWLPSTVPLDRRQLLRVTERQGVADRVSRISQQLETLPHEYLPYLHPAAGAYAWRPIAGTERLSMHSFGIAVDINPAYGSYWRWEDGERPANTPPAEVISIFESEGFIWGGHWYHYDTFHFEYRPELLIDPSTR